MEQLPVEIRLADDRDTRFIASSWLKSFRDGNLVKGVPNNVYYHNHHKVLDTLLPRCVVLVACNADDPDQILGWTCAEVMDGALVIHYTYVKQMFRGWKVAKRLWEILMQDTQAKVVMLTHMTHGAKKIVREKDEEVPIVYNPYLLFMTLPEGWQE